MKDQLGPIANLTYTEAREKLSVLGISLKKIDGEYKVNFKCGVEATSYFTNDLDDAVRTGVEMLFLEEAA